jgi:ubiquinone/menaquinone biosynthesis C-methylase UbiE
MPRSQPDDKVLDIGCGTGNVLLKLEPSVGSIVGIDPAEVTPSFHGTIGCLSFH